LTNKNRVQVSLSLEQAKELDEVRKELGDLPKGKAIVYLCKDWKQRNKKK